MFSFFLKIHLHDVKCDRQSQESVNLKCVGVYSTAEIKVLDFHYFGTPLLGVLMDVPGVIQVHGNQIAVQAGDN